MKSILFSFLILTFNISNAQVSDFMSIDFNKADSIALHYKDHSLNNLPLLAHKLTTSLITDVEKLRAIYTWICTNIKGDFNQDRKVLNKQKKFKNDSLAYMEWNEEYKQTVYKKLVKYKKTMCTGYAYLLKELCFYAHIKTDIVNGYGRTVYSNIDSLELTNHSWNAVKLQDKWYLCDATWSSGYMDSSGSFVQEYNDGYFLADPELFAQNHYPIEKKWLLLDVLVQTPFIASPLVYGEAFKHKLLPALPKEMKVHSTKNKKVFFKLKTLENKEKNSISLVYFLGDRKIEILTSEMKSSNEFITFACTFKYTGIYDVHLSVDDDIVATYTILIKKNKD